MKKPFEEVVTRHGATVLRVCRAVVGVFSRGILVFAPLVGLPSHHLSACLTGGRPAPTTPPACSAMLAVGHLTPGGAAPAPIEAARSRKSARR